MSIFKFEPDFKEARRFLKTLAEKDDEVFTFQTFDDSGTKRPALVRIISGTFAHCKVALADLNKNGAGVFVTINKTNGTGRKKDDIVSLRALFVDKDDGRLQHLKPEPSIVVESKNGDHAYWRLNPEEQLTRFTEAQKLLIKALDTDPSVHDLPRVMRIPGFYHMKEPHDPFLVRLRSVSDVCYSIEEVLSPHAQHSKNESSHEEPGRRAQDELSTEFTAWASSLPTEEGSKNGLGGRNNTLLILIREGLACNLNERDLVKEAHEYCIRSGLDTSVADEMILRQQEEHEVRSFQPRFLKGERKRASPFTLAKSYLSDREYTEKDAIKLRYYQEDFYRYVGSRYENFPRSDLRADVISYLQTQKKYDVLIGSALANNVLANIEGQTFIPASTTVPSYLGLIGNEVAELIPLKNGLLDVNAFMRGAEDFFRGHTPDFFSTTCLPYAFDPKAPCPLWLRFLEQMVPDDEVKRFLQEWFGYNLVPDTNQHKFVLLYGEGANGKSVACVVLRTLLGKDNVSAVGLEQFNPVRTFPLAATAGKLANIVQEMGEVEKVAEGVLKDFTGGDLITVERKFKDPFEFKPTARCTFATNVLPRFKDRSNGLWRRLIPIPFPVQILDESKQDKRMTESSFWLASGELPGIFNWALEGLIQLKKRGSFIEPKVCLEIREEYRKESNPAATFLRENCEVSTGKEIASNTLYRYYAAWVKSRGGVPLGEPLFAKEVKRTFRSVELSEHPRRQTDQTRSREWIGLDWIEGSVPGDHHEF